MMNLFRRKRPPEQRAEPADAPEAVEPPSDHPLHRLPRRRATSPGRRAGRQVPAAASSRRS